MYVGANREDAMGDKTIVVLATLDTKGREAQYLRGRIEESGDRALIVDAGVVGAATTEADVTREQVATAGETPLDRLLENPSREVAAPVMAAGATRIVSELVAQGECITVLFNSRAFLMPVFLAE